VTRVLVVGGANMDLIAVADRLPDRGETLLATTYRESPGGKAANIASAAAAWGAPVSFVGRVGDDTFGETLLDAWRGAGVDTTHVRRDPSGTGLGLVFMDAAGQYQTLVAPRSNARLLAADVDDLPEALWADVGAVALALEAPAAVTTASAAIAAARSLPLVLNAAPSAGMTPALWGAISHLVVNEHEAAELSGSPADDPEAADRAGRALLARLAPERAAAVIVTLGERGAVLARPGRPSHHALAPSVRAVDTLGAGDTFVGVLAAEVARGADLVAAVEEACRAATAAVTVEGARAHVTHEVAERIARTSAHEGAPA
jgi:ribokinase